MTLVLKVKGNEEHNQKIWTYPLIPFQEHRFSSKFSLHSSKSLVEIKSEIFLCTESTNLHVMIFSYLQLRDAV